MTIAYIYIRVSTDEQADKGYSQRHQEEVLRKYCELKGFQIRQIFIEDYSAKNFDRPEWKKLLLQLKKDKGIVNLVLFTKWDRFSRNTSDAYGMINTINKMGAEPQAIEQPLDLSIPENKIMLAFYLAMPEAENDRRSLNVSVGMRKAMKEGRYMGKAPIGYSNKQNENRKWIEPDPATAPVVKTIFESIASGKYSIESILRYHKETGLICSKNNFWNLVRNPVYCGQIFVPAYKSEEAILVNGQHEAIISKALFLETQDILNGKKKIQKSKKTTDDRFPLRGFVQCHSCGKLLTASASKGRKQYYEYYHCTSDCGTRFPAAAVNESLVSELQKLKPHPAVNILFQEILKDVLSANKQQQQEQLIKIQQELSTIEKRHQKALELLLNDNIEPDDYKKIKRSCEESTIKLEARIATITQQPVDIRADIEKGTQILQNIDLLYSKAATESKRQIVDSIFSEKLIYTENGYRTVQYNEAVQLIFNTGAAFRENKMGQLVLENQLSHEVNPLVSFSNHFIHDLRKLANLYSLLKAS